MREYSRARGDAVFAEDEEQFEHGAPDFLAAEIEVEVFDEGEGDVAFHGATVDAGAGGGEVGGDAHDFFGVAFDGGDPEVGEGVAEAAGEVAGETPV